MSLASSPSIRPRLADLPAASRSRITNGALGIDLRTRSGRRWRDIYLDAMRQTGGRHEQTCRSIASLTLRHEQLDAQLAKGEDVDTSELVKLSGAIGRALVRAGLTADDEPGEDVTAEIVARIRATAEEAA